jgi:hypothetical protein
MVIECLSTKQIFMEYLVDKSPLDSVKRPFFMERH